jgi:cytochrome c oxidase subunit 3
MAHSTATAATGKSVWDGGVSPMGASYGKLMMWFFLLSDAFTFSGLLDYVWIGSFFTSGI